MCTLGLGMYLLVGAAHADIPKAPPCPTSLSGITFCNKISNSNAADQGACTTTIDGQDWYAFYNDGTDPRDSSVPLATYDETSDEWDTIFKNYFNCKGGEEKDADPDHCSTFDCAYDGGICCFWARLEYELGGARGTSN